MYVKILLKSTLVPFFLGVLFFTTFAQDIPGKIEVSNASTNFLILKDQFIISFNKGIYTPFVETKSYKSAKTRALRAKAYNQYNSSLQRKVLANLAKADIRGLDVVGFSSGTGICMVVRCNSKTAILLSESIKNAKVFPDVNVISYRDPTLVARRSDKSEMYSVKQTKEPVNQPYLEQIGAVGTSGEGKAVFVISNKVITHPDLNLNENLSIDLVNVIPDLATNGNPIAGIVAAKDNNLGLTGIASGAEVISIATLNNNGQYSWSNLVLALSYCTGIADPGDCIVIDDALNYSFNYTNDDEESIGDPVVYLINEVVEYYNGDPVEMDEYLLELQTIAREMVRNNIQYLGMNSRYVSISAGGEPYHNLKDTFLGDIQGPNIYYCAGYYIGNELRYNQRLFYIDNSVDYVALDNMQVMVADYYANSSVPILGNTSDYSITLDQECTYCPAAAIAGILLANDGVIYHNGNLETEALRLDPNAPIVTYTFRIASAR